MPKAINPTFIIFPNLLTGALPTDFKGGGGALFFFLLYFGFTGLLFFLFRISDG